MLLLPADSYSNEYDVVDKGLGDDFFDNATQYESSDAVGSNRDSTYTSSKIDPNYIDPNIVPIVKQPSGNVPTQKKTFGMSFTDIANKTVKHNLTINNEPEKSEQVKKKPRKSFGLSFSDMAAFTQDEELVTKNYKE